MKKKGFFEFGLVVVICLLIYIGVTNTNTIRKKIVESKLDTIYVKECDTIVLHKTDTIYVLDSIWASSLLEENATMRYKLERIKEYNRIAGKGQNSVFLRGWIRRVLED